MEFIWKVNKDLNDTYMRIRSFCAEACDSLGRIAPRQRIVVVMRLVSLMLFLAVFQVTAGDLEAQQVSLQKKDVTLLEVLQVIRKQTGYLFVCDMEMIKKANKVNLNLKRSV